MHTDCRELSVSIQDYLQRVIGIVRPEMMCFHNQRQKFKFRYGI
jgi:hypothetical protein